MTPDHPQVALLSEKVLPPPARRCVCHGHGRQPTSTIWKCYQNEIQSGKFKLKNHSEKRAMKRSPPKGRHPAPLASGGVETGARLMEECPPDALRGWK